MSQAEIHSIFEKDIQLGELVGAGSFGKGIFAKYTEIIVSVFRARWQETLVAVKVVVLNLSIFTIFQRSKASAASPASVMAEARVWQSFRHPHVVSFFGTFVDTKERLCLVSEFSPFGSLSTFLRNHSKDFKPADLVKMAQDAAKGMLYLHSLHFVHRFFFQSCIITHQERDLAARNLLVFQLDGKYTIKASLLI